MKYNDEIKKKFGDEVIAFFRIDCISNCILEIINYLMNKLGDSTINTSSLSSVKIDYLKKIHSDNKLIKELPRLFNNDFLDGNFTSNENIISVSETLFFQQAINCPKSTRVVLIISIKSKKEYISQFQYSFLLINYLRKKGININIILNPVDECKEKYNSEYFRIRTALKISYAIDFIFLRNTFWFFNPNTLQCKRIYSSVPNFGEENIDVGGIFPILNVTKDQYNVLCRPCKLSIYDRHINSVSDFNEKALLTWCEVELNKFAREADNDLKNKIVAFTEKDNYLDTILFLYTCYAILKEENYRSKNKTYEIKVNILNSEKLTYLHEICIDFSQGILQLLENIILHVVKDSNVYGCGTLSLRLHKDEKKQFKMYIYINDLQFVSFNGIVKKFIQNNPFFTNTDTLKLNHFFDGENKIMENYLNNTEQIAMHYGLQILDCVVKEHNGQLYVSSGEDAYINNELNAHSLSYCGTAYEIEFSIKNIQPQSISYSDMVFPIQEKDENNFRKTILLLFYEEKDAIGLKIGNYYCKIGGKDKWKLVSSLRDELIKQCNNIDCLIVNLINITDIRVYEIIAKSLFLFLNQSDSINHVAIVNLSNRYDVVKMFRQFALFFNRKGISPFNDNKKIFIIDKDGDFDVLISGTQLNDIKKLSLYERIYGGIDFQMQNIINSITKRK